MGKFVNLFKSKKHAIASRKALEDEGSRVGIKRYLEADLLAQTKNVHYCSHCNHGTLDSKTLGPNYCSQCGRKRV